MMILFIRIIFLPGIMVIRNSAPLYCCQKNGALLLTTGRHSHRILTFGSGYQFLVIKIFSQGLKVSDSDEQGVDNLCLPCYCATPGGLLADDLTDHSATLIWDNVGALNYEVRYRPKGGSWISTEVNNTFMQLTSSFQINVINGRVRAECEGSWTAWSAISNFMTPATGSLCTSPTDLSVSWTTANAALVTWEKYSGFIAVQSYLEGHLRGPWLTQYISDTSVQLSSCCLPFV